MASVITYNQVIGILKNICERHYQINSFFLGRDWELENNDDITYPLFQIYPDSARLPISNGEYKTIEFRIVCKIVDLVEQSESNEKDVHSDCLRIAQDIINELNQHPFYINSNASLVGDINISALEEYEDDFTAGWEFALNLKLINVNSYCGLPFEEITGYSANGPTSTGFSYSVQYLTCDTVTACTTFQNYIENKIANIPTGTTDIISATTVIYQVYSETIPKTNTTYVIDGNNGNYQSLTFNTGTTITYSNMKPGYYSFLINLTGNTTLTLSGSSGWYTPNAIPVGFYQPLTLMSCIYDGSKMVVSTYEQLSQIV